MAKAASSPDLRAAFQEHLEQTRGQVERLEQIFEKLDVRPRGKKCKAMEGLIEEGEVAGETPRAPGVLRHWLTAFYPVPGPGPGPTWVGAVVTEITERKRMEEALRDSDRRKDEFLAVLAHELRNPLAPVRTALEILKVGGAAGPAADEAREILGRQVDHLVHLVDDLLDISRINRGKMRLRLERVELATAVARAVETARPLIDAQRHELTVALPPRPVRLNADLTRLAQVLANLLNNAAKYTEPGGRIWLTAEPAGGEVVVRVRDTGVGIPAEMLPQVFEMFTQVDRSLERSQGGLGIGLTLVRSLVQLHGGRVEARSDGPGRGSEFTVYLPLPPQEPSGPGGPELGEVRQGRAGPARRVLVVDDNKDSAQSLALFLTLLGNEVRLAHDGPGAVEAAKAFVPDVVLLAIGLPGLSGYDVCRRIRQEPALRHAVLVAQTGWGQEEDRRRSREAGFDHHLAKPVDPDVLQELLATAPVRGGRPGEDELK